MASAAAIDRRTRCGTVVTRGILLTVHDLYGGRLPLLPLELYFQLRRHHDVQPFRFRPRTQVRRFHDTRSVAFSLSRATQR